MYNKVHCCFFHETTFSACEVKTNHFQYSFWWVWGSAGGELGVGWAGVGSESKTNHLQETFFRIGFTIKSKSFLEKLFWRGQMDFAVLFLWGSDGLCGAFFVGVRWTLGCFFCGGQMDFGVLFLWGSDGLCGAFFVGVRWTLGCFFCGGQMDFVVLILWGSDGLWGAFFVVGRWTLGCFFLWWSDGLCGAFFVVVRWTLRCFFCGGQMDFGVLFFAVPVFNRGNRRAGKKKSCRKSCFWGAFFVGVSCAFLKVP